jgi:AcrR family transcriptional regulator
LQPPHGRSPTTATTVPRWTRSPATPATRPAPSTGTSRGKEDLFLGVYEAYAAARAREFDDIHARAQGSTGERARAYADQWMARLSRDPDFLVLSVEFLVHAWRNPQLREAFSHRVAAGRLALARILEEEARNGAFELPMPADGLATALREMGSGLGLAKLIDTDAVPDTLFGDFIEMLFRLLRERRHKSARATAKPGQGKATGTSRR